MVHQQLTLSYWMCNLWHNGIMTSCSIIYLKVRKVKSSSELWIELIKPTSLLQRPLVLEIFLLCYVIIIYVYVREQCCRVWLVDYPGLWVNGSKTESYLRRVLLVSWNCRCVVDCCWHHHLHYPFCEEEYLQNAYVKFFRYYICWHCCHICNCWLINSILYMIFCDDDNVFIQTLISLALIGARR